MQLEIILFTNFYFNYVIGENSRNENRITVDAVIEAKSKGDRIFTAYIIIFP